MSGKDAEIGKTAPEGAETFRVPARVQPASELLIDLLSSTAFDGQNIDKEKAVLAANAFLEKFLRLMSDSLEGISQDYQIAIRLGPFPQIQSANAHATEAVAKGLKRLLPPQ